jgi:hypothetical protein
MCNEIHGVSEVAAGKFPENAEKKIGTSSAGYSHGLKQAIVHFS